MVMDAVGRLAEVGQKVAFGQANKGAHPLRVGVISKVSAKTATIEYERIAKRWSDGAEIVLTETAQRGAGAFVVVQE
ncbi:hypothetical protein VLC6_31 [Klebsiella phage VLC6]|uniref:Uncharacterized protein n=1 Tax=Klebsiella phage VLC6 TaxID=2723743 RepID=A0A6M3YPI1_9CAUD|nr:hypothetical protein VLC6_31 [Klebsiella phage VLC6]